MDRDDAQLPREQLPITLFDGVVLAVRSAEGNIYLVVHDLCTALDLIPSSQLRAIRADERLHLVSFRLRIGRQVRTLECLLLDDIPLWLIKVRPPRNNAQAAERLRYVQNYLIASVRSAFAVLTGLPDAPSNQIEDLQELDVIDSSLRFTQIKVVAAVEGDVLPQQRRQVLQIGIIDRVALLPQVVKRIHHIPRIPDDNRVDNQAHTGCPVELAEVIALAEQPLLAKKHLARQRVQ